MEDSEALLRFIHKNAAMGVGTLPQALSLPQSRAMTSALQDQLREYRAIAARSQSYAKQKGLHLKGPGSAALTMSGMMLRAQTALDPSTSKLAEMMIQGSTMGVTSLTRQIRDYDGEDTEVLDFAKKQLKREEKNIDELKKFL